MLYTLNLYNAINYISIKLKKKLEKRTLGILQYKYYSSFTETVG